MTADRLRALHKICRDRLCEDAVAFWIPRAVDLECGGFLTAASVAISVAAGVTFSGTFRWFAQPHDTS